MHKRLEVSIENEKKSHSMRVMSLSNKNPYLTLKYKSQGTKSSHKFQSLQAIKSNQVAYQFTHKIILGFDLN